MLQLGDTKLELVEVCARDEAELVKDAFEPGAGLLAHADRFASPPARRLLDQFPGLVSAHVPLGRQLVGQCVCALRGQRDRAERCEPHPLDGVENRLIFVGHGALPGGAAGGARVWSPRPRKRVRGAARP
jgi:hypothetical protein